MPRKWRPRNVLIVNMIVLPSAIKPHGVPTDAYETLAQRWLTAGPPSQSVCLVGHTDCVYKSYSNFLPIVRPYPSKILSFEAIDKDCRDDISHSVQLLSAQQFI